jgi:hypothetical protein
VNIGRWRWGTVWASVAVWCLGCGADEDIRISTDPPLVGGGVAPTCSLQGLNLSGVDVDRPIVETFDAGVAALPDAGDAGGELDAGHAAPALSTDQRPFFSFFVTSQAGLFSLPAGQYAPAPDRVNGYGGDFGGLRGADEICTMLARRSNPGDTKIWRAFLSSSGLLGGARQHAIERVGQGPWYDFNGRELASSLQGLLPDASGRPSGADPQLARMFTDENGEAARPAGQDNHDTLTGSDACGRLYDDGASGRIATCEDWTSKSVRGTSGDLTGRGGQVPVGHSWPRAFGPPGSDAATGARWASDHTVNGCEPGAHVSGGLGAPSEDYRVGAGGGYGGIYCFALGARVPSP